MISSWLGDPSAVGAVSWLQAFTWIATLLIAVAAWASLRRQSLQSRASLILELAARWDGIEESRRVVYSFLHTVTRATLAEHSHINHVAQLNILRHECHQRMKQLRKTDQELIRHLVAYLVFIETLGMYVLNGYIPYRDIVQLYKGPIMDVELVSTGFISDWQTEALMEVGLFENALYLMSRTRIRKERPYYYRIVYPFKRAWRAAGRAIAR